MKSVQSDPGRFLLRKPYILMHLRYHCRILLNNPHRFQVPVHLQKCRDHKPHIRTDLQDWWPYQLDRQYILSVLWYPGRYLGHRQYRFQNPSHQNTYQLHIQYIPGNPLCQQNSRDHRLHIQTDLQDWWPYPLDRQYILSVLWYPGKSLGHRQCRFQNPSHPYRYQLHIPYIPGNLQCQQNSRDHRLHIQTDLQDWWPYPLDRQYILSVLLYPGKSLGHRQCRFQIPSHQYTYPLHIQYIPENPLYQRNSRDHRLHIQTGLQDWWPVLLDRQYILSEPFDPGSILRCSPDNFPGQTGPEKFLLDRLHRVHRHQQNLAHIHRHSRLQCLYSGHWHHRYLCQLHIHRYLCIHRLQVYVHQYPGIQSQLHIRHHRHL